MEEPLDFYAKKRGVFASSGNSLLAQTPGGHFRVEARWYELGC